MQFPPIVVIAPTHDMAKKYINSSNFIGFGRMPILADPNTACWKLVGSKGYLIVLVNCVDIGPEYSYRLEQNVVIRTTF